MANRIVVDTPQIQQITHNINIARYFYLEYRAQSVRYPGSLAAQSAARSAGLEVNRARRLHGKLQAAFAEALGET